jgi:hypothetical protein
MKCPTLESLVKLVRRGFDDSQGTRLLILSWLIGIYRNGQRPELLETFSPKVKTVYDIFTHGKLL